MNNTIIQSRIDNLEPTLKRLYKDVYNQNIYFNTEDKYNDLLKLVTSYAYSRKGTYRKADVKSPNWYKNNTIVGTTLYVDLFSGNFKKFLDYIPYLGELGINLIHFMPVLESREGENDGGYAVKNYKSIDKRFGTNKDFELVLARLKELNIHVCVDFVVNHTAKEHEFALKALEGNKEYMNMYFMYDNDEIPKQFDFTVPEVFPKVSPGNFTYYDSINKWVFTSFYNFQWDLNYQNPMVFEKIIDILLFLANKGIDMIRLDAIPFMWKQLGHSCRNHPTIHKLLEMFNIIMQIVAPSVALLGEAIVEPEEIVKYCGEDAPECDLMYNATQMVNLWNSIATRDTRLLQTDTKRLNLPSDGVWINYLRCHDDIGWGFNEDKLSSLGFDPSAHKQFLINFYQGNFNGSFSIGELYEFDETTMDARNCGTMASLLGLEQALKSKDLYQRELSLKRIHMLNAVLMSSTGIPLIYSGDEIGTLNNYDYLNDSKKQHDTRWIHRSVFNHDLALNRLNSCSIEADIFNNIKSLISIRKETALFSSNYNPQVIDTGNNSIYCFKKQGKHDSLMCLFNFSEDRQFIAGHNFNQNYVVGTYEDIITGKQVDFSEENILMGPYEYMWLKPLY